MPEVVANGVRLHYLVEGSGPPVLFLHALGGDHLGFAPVTERLEARFTCVRVDQRGSGLSETPPGPYTTALLAQDAAALLDLLALGPAHVVGTSTGGGVAQELALARADLVASLALVSTWGFRDPWFSEVIESWMRMRPLIPPERFYPAIALWAFTHRFYERGLGAALAKAMAAYPFPQSVEGFLGQAAAARDHDAGARLGGVRCRTAVVVGEEDILTPPRMAEALADAIPGARLRTVPGLGHGLFAEDPAGFAALLEELLGASS